MGKDSPATSALSRSAPATELLAAESLGASLTVSDLAASVAWYRDVFGFAVDREHRREDKLIAVSLRAGGVRILLTQDNGARGSDRAKGEGFSLLLTTTQDIDALAAGIRARGGSLDSEPADIAGMRAFRLHDPDGFRFTVSTPLAG
ncbi:MAG TPA: VOC family protein [Gemmatimonadaceae bacterium]|jgi:predicted enzyme related to lactoylglutathione lyase|nr:VOC family protein [Gemmatimonadaceae bacterium]